MLNLFKSLWNDESGAVVCAEMACLATLGIVGAGVGAATLVNSADEELKDVAHAFRSLDQGYCYHGFQSRYAATAGSGYQQVPVKVARKNLRNYERELELLRRRALQHERRPPVPPTPPKRKPGVE